MPVSRRRPRRSAVLACLLWGATATVNTAGAAAPRVKLGVDVLAAQDFAPLRGKRVGLITNPTGVNGELRSTIDVLRAAPEVQLVALYGPEHGVRGEIAAGEHVQDAVDSRTGLPTFSLYGKTRKATPEMLKGIDVLVYDLQDIGARSYTFISTLALGMEAAAENGVAFMVLDRPNPLGGERVEGRPLNLKYKSFVGQLPIAYLHGLTVGELAQMINGEKWLENGITCDLTVIPLEGWTRDMQWRDTGLAWVPTSPHVPHDAAAAFYAATGIMGELQVFSEGVGTPTPFELAGAPDVDPAALAEELNGRGLAGVRFRPLYFKPFYARFREEICGGVQIHLLDSRAAALTPIQFHIMDAARQLKPDLQWFGAKRDAMFNKVTGTDQVQEAWRAGKSIDEILAVWDEGVEAFRAQRKSYLRY